MSTWPKQLFRGLRHEKIQKKKKHSRTSPGLQLKNFLDLTKKRLNLDFEKKVFQKKSNPKKQ